MSCKIDDKLLKGAIKAINKKQEETIKKADKIIGDVESFENNRSYKKDGYC